MYIARILYPVKVLGPGKRIGIWFDGCNHHCVGCSNPELWESQEKYHTKLETVMDMLAGVIRNNDVDGFTLTGGDPLEQPEALRELLPEISMYTDDIILYTGYKYEEVQEKYDDILKFVAVLVDGPYIESRNKEELLRGSTNQRVLILNDKYKAVYEKYLKESPSEVQNFTSPTGVISVGIHRPGYKEELDSFLITKGLKKDE